MYQVIILSVLVCFFLILTVLTNPTVSIRGVRIRIFYWTAPVIGALMLLAAGWLPADVMWQGMTSPGGINPLKILTLFISMTILSIFLDEAGFFSYLAGVALRAASASQRKLFCALFLLVSVLTVFTSNDIIILTFTPFICYFSKKTGIDPMPYLFGEFVAANTWSMMLVIGNPTNIYLSAACGIGFGAYTAVMFLPTVLAGLTAFCLLLWIFRKSLSKPMAIHDDPPVVRNRAFIAIGLGHLILCTILLVISAYIRLEMWFIALGVAVSLFLCVTIYKKVRRCREHILLHTLVRAPWELIPFVLSMFILVLGLEQYQVMSLISRYLGENAIVWKYGVTSFLAANVMNNIPMAVAFSAIAGNLQEKERVLATFASVIGSNLGAYFTPLGALAGIMWAGILGRMGISFSFKRYVSYGVRISLPALAAALLGLSIALAF